MANFDPFSGFETGRKLAGKSSFQTALEGFGKSREEDRKYQRDLSLLKAKGDIDVENEVKKQRALYDLEKEIMPSSPEGAMPFSKKIGNTVYRYPQQGDIPVSMVDPRTGKVTQSGTVPRGSKAYLKRLAPQSTLDAVANIDAVDEALQGVKKQLKLDPSKPLKALNPFSEREYKAYYNALRRRIAQEVGGKTLTLNEQQIIKENLPEVLDINNPEAYMTKLNLIENTLKRAKRRLQTGELYPDENINQELPSSGESEMILDSSRTGNIEQDYDNLVEQLISSGIDEEEAQSMADQQFGL